jgi:mannose-6-phosphate isomerase-like protein (cupin superfamily)
MTSGIQTFRFEEAVGRAVPSTRGRGIDGAGSPGLKVVQYPIDTGIAEINLRFGYDQIGDGFFTPRHRHNFDQFRYVVSGEMNLGKGIDLHEGECVYVPEGTYYGPLSQKGPVALIVLQFPGPNGAYRIKDSDKSAAMAALKAKGGYFEDGVYKIKQPDGHSINQDSYEAVWEQHMGEPISYAAPRYETPIIIRPQGFRWRADPRRPGVEIKHLGTFNEYGTSVALWRIEPGAVIASETLDAPQVRCVVRGATTYGGKKLDDKACYYIPEGIGTEPLASPDGAELLVFSIPMYARATWEKAKSHRVAATA